MTEERTEQLREGSADKDVRTDQDGGYERTEIRDFAGRVREAIDGAEQVLIGIGEQFAASAEPEKTAVGRRYMENRRRAGNEGVLSEAEEGILAALALEEASERKGQVQAAYEELYALVGEKPHFVVTMNADDWIYGSPFAEERIVAPCGSMHMLQCRHHILERFETEPLFLRAREAIREGKVLGTSADEQTEPFPVCPVCQGILRPNTIRTKGYLEDGYLPQWKAYTQWLSRTLNQRLCVLELGVTFEHPSVFRFPAEKTVFYNRKAKLFRVNERFWQIPEELKEKGEGLQADALAFALGLAQGGMLDDGDH